MTCFGFLVSCTPYYSYFVPYVILLFSLLWQPLKCGYWEECCPQPLDLPTFQIILGGSIFCHYFYFYLHPDDTTISTSRPKVYCRPEKLHWHLKFNMSKTKLNIFSPNLFLFLCPLPQLIASFSHPHARNLKVTFAFLLFSFHPLLSIDPILVILLL